MIFMIPAQAKEHVSFYLFYGDGCPHCAHEKEWLDTIQKEYPNVTFELLETWYQEENQELYKKVLKSYQLDKSGVPLTIIGDKYFYGFNDYTKEEILKLLNHCGESSCEDYVSKIKQGEEVTIKKVKEVKPTTETKVKVEAKKAFVDDDALLIMGIVVVLALLFGIVGVNFIKSRKSVD